MFFLIRTEGASRRNLLILGCSLLLALAYAVKEAGVLSARTGTAFSPLVAVGAILVFFAVFALISCDLWSMKGSVWTYMAGDPDLSGLPAAPAFRLHALRSVPQFGWRVAGVRLHVRRDRVRGLRGTRLCRAAQQPPVPRLQAAIRAGRHARRVSASWRRRAAAHHL